jgi:hypothetical protein
MKRPFEILILLVVIAVIVSFVRHDESAPGQEPPAETPTAQPDVSLKDPDIGYALTFNRLRPGMTLAEAEKIFGPPDYIKKEVRYQQWESPLTQVHFSEDGVLTEVTGSGYGILYLGDKAVFRCGQPESDIIKTFGQPLSVEDMQYNYAGMSLFCGSAEGDNRWVSAMTLGGH